MNRVDWPTLLPALLLVGLGLATFYSIDRQYFFQQLVFFFIAILFYFIFLNLNFKIFALFSKQIYFVFLIILLITFFIGIEAKGATRWIEIFGLRLQFSEIFKPFIVLFFANFLTGDSLRSFLKFITSFLLLLPIFFLIAKQPDLGNAMILLFTVFFMNVFYGFSIFHFLAIGVPAIAFFPLIFHFLRDYQKERIFSFLNISYDPLGSSYNAIQSIISVGSGGLFGKGMGQATQSVLKFLPERHTDFIFATISESLGMVGSVFVLFLYLIFLFRIIKILSLLEDDFSKMVLAGFFFLFLTHIFFNIGMNIGLFPIVGITLPFVSYGGSSLLTNFIILGIISSISFESKRITSIEIG